MKRIAINGFGRIGRAAFKIALTKPDLEVVAINDLTDAATLAHLLAYDTVYGRYAKNVSARENIIVIAGEEYPVLAQADPSHLPWKDFDVDIVLECTGRFVDSEKMGQHLKAGAKKVILSAPSKGGGDVPTYLLGVNDQAYTAEQSLISNASCTTNCIAPVAKIIQREFGVAKAMMTTIHSYTTDQNLHDSPHKDLRRARAAAQNIVPTTTGAAIATTEVIPELQGLFDGLALRVPTMVVSLTDFTFLLGRKTSKEEVNEAFQQTAARPEFRGILAVTEAPLVSS
ncbi:MAG: glyceraldehyde-3-phosphate dehydrogenase, partial [Nitrososphaera sp.]|nr:glyceraldehyde-3-phosphate dehydrogenase [Nitrososphaera sp.]